MTGIVEGKYLGKNFGESEDRDRYTGAVTKSQYMYIMVFSEQADKSLIDYVFVPADKWNEFDKLEFGASIRCEVEVTVSNGRKRLNYK